MCVWDAPANRKAIKKYNFLTLACSRSSAWGCWALHLKERGTRHRSRPFGKSETDDAKTTIHPICCPSASGLAATFAAWKALAKFIPIIIPQVEWWHLWFCLMFPVPASQQTSGQLGHNSRRPFKKARTGECLPRGSTSLEELANPVVKRRPDAFCLVKCHHSHRVTHGKFSNTQQLAWKIAKLYQSLYLHLELAPFPPGMHSHRT